MKAMILEQIGSLESNPTPLRAAVLPVPTPGLRELLIRVSACGVCHTELDEIEGRAPPPWLPVVPGHQVIGRVEAAGSQVGRFTAGDRVGVAWIYSTCGVCSYCRSGRENLCPDFRATGRDDHGGYAEYMTVNEAYAYPIPEDFSDAQAAPLLCAGAIGYRSLKLSRLEDGQSLGLMGFGASAHLVIQMVRQRYPAAEVYVFARSVAERQFARQLGAAWSGGITEEAPHPVDAVIDTTPAWLPVTAALKALAPGGRLVINAIRKEAGDQNALLEVDYPTHLWMEKEIKSVANVTRRDVSEFLQLASENGLQPEVQEYPLQDANRALLELKAGRSRGARVLRIG